MASAAAAILLFYAFIGIVSAVLMVWIALEMVAVLVGTRVGLAGYLIRYTERDIKFLLLLLRGLWLRRGPTYRLKLEPSEAPGLVRILNELASRLNIPPPDIMYLEMNAGAWVELTGLRRDLGRAHVGVGYDLLAGLTEQEVEAVMAHELVHAKMVIRVFKRWLNAGLFRASNVMRQVSGTVHGYRKAKKKYFIAEFVLGTGHGLTRWCARMVATYSRQDEFDADRGAAELCGSAALGSALQKLSALEPKLGRLPWNERVAQIQSPEGLSHWLLNELSLPASGPQEEDSARLANQYSTHPSEHDRIAALPTAGRPLRESPPGIGLLANPDAIAQRLVGEIERQQQKLEEKDQREVQRWMRKIRRSQPVRVRPLQLPGLLFGILVVFMAMGAVAADNGLAGLVTLAGGIPLAVLLYRWGGHRDRHQLPVPDFSLLKAAWTNDLEAKDIEVGQKEIEQRLREKLATIPKKKRQIAFLVGEAYNALGRCEYLPAHVASRLCLDLDKNSTEAALAVAIAAAAFHQGPQSNQRLNYLMKTTRLRTPSLAWGSAWAYVLKGEWMAVEALLLEKVKKQPDEPTFLTLLALAQSRRGKLQSAIGRLRRVGELQPGSLEPAKLLIQLLLDRGDIQEAARQIQPMEAMADQDRELQFSMIRLHLLRKEFSQAESWEARFTAQALPGHRLIDLAKLFESARKDDRATDYYQRALEGGHFPEALLGLARLDLRSKNKALARIHILGALDVTKPLGKKAHSAFEMFPASIGLLLGLEETTPNCQAWLVRLVGGAAGGPLAQRTLVIFAREIGEAQGYMLTLAQAMEPGKPPPSLAGVEAILGTQDMQPVYPVRPGIQYVYN